jgi:hypothetical protein
LTSATKIEQSANAVVMIRPHHFFPNPETASDNAFQRQVSLEGAESISKAARDEFDKAVDTLGENGVMVHVFQDEPTPEKPDAVFPNNWFSTHPDGRIALYPMFSPSRRRERRQDLIDELGRIYRVTGLLDYSSFEERGLFLEGTGSLVLDYPNQVAYVSFSKRSSPELVQRFCADFSFQPMTFESIGDDGRPIYHTNVLLCVGSELALIGLELIADQDRRVTVRHKLEASGKRVIELSRAQIADFAGNALELRSGSENLLVLSTRATEALSREQRSEIVRYARIVSLDIPTIELAGGSARCMMAAIHLPPR